MIDELYIGAIDIGGTKIAAGVVNGKGQVLARQECPTEPEKGLADGLERMIHMVRACATAAGVSLQGIGIGCTGPVNPEQGTIGNVQFLTGWEGADLADSLSRAFGVSTAIENDADAAALGEWAWGVGAGTKSFLLVTVGTGIGAGLVVDGKLYRGVDGSHPEIGHHIIDPSGPACFCGAHGCWERMASGPAMEHWAQEQHPQKVYRSAKELCLLARQGELLAQAAVERTARYLGIGLANLVTLFSPDVIALGGGLLGSYDLFREMVEMTIHASCGLVPHEKVRVTPAALGADTGLAGAARAWYNRYFPLFTPS
jgi:glucokinase